MLPTEEEDNAPLIRNDVEGRSSTCYVKDWVGYIVAICLILFGIVSITVINVYQEKIKDEYGVVLDAGSTHTSMFVYKWTVNDVVKGTALVKQIGDCTVTDKDGKVKGISSYGADPGQAGKSLQSCIKSTAKKLIPSYLRDKSPIYLGATAGMRLLKETNATAADRILGSVRRTLASSPFMFKENFARIISGEEEGLSSWVTVNYLNGALKDLKDTSQKDGVLVSQKLVGALDMGGASTQITFVFSKPPPHSSKLKLYGNEYQLYTHSYLCYGKKEAERRYLAQLVKDSEFSATVDNPCGPKGHQRNVTSNYLWVPPCVQGQHSKRTSFTLKGTGNYTLCAKQVDKLFNFSSCRGSSNCSFNGVYQAPIQDGVTFFAFSGYYVVIRDLNLTSNVSLDELENATKNICRKSWDEIVVIPSNPLYLALYCFDAQYILTILKRGYHFEKSKPILRFVRSVNQRSLGWALGFMINATNLLPVDNPGTISIHLIQTGVFLVVVIVGALLISTGVLICTLSARRRMMWAAGSLASVSMITYPSMSALVSCNAEADQQGVVQGMITGIRGLCNGIGPALFGFVFYVFHVDLEEGEDQTVPVTISSNHTTMEDPYGKTIVSGAPFLFGAGSVILSLLLAFFLPDNNGNLMMNARSPTRRNSEYSFQSECETSGSELRDINASSDNAPLLSDTKPL